jgi:hypothetical protein
MSDVSRETRGYGPDAYGKKAEKHVPRALAYAQAKAASEHRLAERSERGRKAAQKRVQELEAVLRDAHHWMAQNGAQTPLELRRILKRAETYSKDYQRAESSRSEKPTGGAVA